MGPILWTPKSPPASPSLYMDMLLGGWRSGGEVGWFVLWVGGWGRRVVGKKSCIEKLERIVRVGSQTLTPVCKKRTCKISKEIFFGVSRNFTAVLDVLHITRRALEYCVRLSSSLLFKSSNFGYALLLCLKKA